IERATGAGYTLRTLTPPEGPAHFINQRRQPASVAGGGVILKTADAFLCRARATYNGSA
ncbi:unnamed protein product, partial [Phaeothamnion confervicola]